MAKDPAFLFYSKDWLEGTAEMLPAEKGIYIDLLCHQHQKGDLPSSTERLCRIVGMAHSDFLLVWPEVSKKFVVSGERLLNQKLNDVMNERSEKGKRNTISGTFAAVLRKANLSKKEYNFARSNFKIEDFERLDSERLTECLTEWLYKCLKSIENGNANEDTNEDTNTTGNGTEVIQPAEIIKTPLQSAFDSWIEMRKKIKAPVTTKGIELGKAELKRLARGDEQLAIEIINQSILNNWKGFFPINKKQQHNGNRDSKADSREELYRESVSILSGNQGSDY